MPARNIEAMIMFVLAGADEAVQSKGKSQSMAQGTQSLATHAGIALERISAWLSEVNERKSGDLQRSGKKAQASHEYFVRHIQVQSYIILSTPIAMQRLAKSLRRDASCMCCAVALISVRSPLSSHPRLPTAG